MTDFGTGKAASDEDFIVGDNVRSSLRNSDCTFGSWIEHNMHRANHSANKLTWDNALASYAHTIAKRCVFAHDMLDALS